MAARRPPLAYLSGAIEHAPDGGRAWRRDAAAFLATIGHRVFDPTENELKFLDEVERREFRAWKRTDPERFRRTVRRFIAADLDVIANEADYVICLWDEAATRGGGSHAEVTYAHRLGKPVYLVTALPHDAVSGWVLACASELFDGFEALYRRLGEIDRGSAPPE